MTEDDTTNDLFWHAINYRSAITPAAEAMWQELKACVDRLIATEREACAKVCEALWKQEADAAANGTQEPKYHDAIECAYAIRARSNTP